MDPGDTSRCMVFTQGSGQQFQGVTGLSFCGLFPLGNLASVVLLAFCLVK